MRILGWEFKRSGFKLSVQKAVTSSLPGSGGWWSLIREPFAGAWQQGRSWRMDTILAHHAVYACVTLISNDVGKLRPKLVRTENGIWTEITSQDYSPVLRKPNRYQNYIQFKEWWITSKLLRGNTYVLLERGRNKLVTAMYLLDPTRVTVLVAENGSVFYQLGEDNLSGVSGVDNVVPASEIIHDRMNCLFHPLVGVSPIFACGMAANIGLTIQGNADAFFANGSNPSGVLSTPKTIPDTTAKRIQEFWETEYSGDKSGRVAVLGDDLKYTPLRMSAVESQMIEHLKWTAETVCSAFHVPAFKIGVGTMPTYQNGEILNQIYYQDCLQSHIEQMEAGLDEGLGLMQFGTMGVELDLDGLLRMDSATQVKTLAEGIGGALMTPNEARKKVDLKPLEGGDTVYLQQQNYSLQALSKRDQRPDPFATAQPASKTVPAISENRLALAQRVKMRERTYRMAA